MWVGAEAEDGIRDRNVTGVQTCALPICRDLKVEAIEDYPRLETYRPRQHGAGNHIDTQRPAGSVQEQVFNTLAHCKARVVPIDLQPKRGRSEERRVGKECRCGWGPKQKTAYEIET